MTIRIEGLTFETIIGILDFERRTPQRVIVDCIIEYEGEYVDYAVVREMIIRKVTESVFGLIEDALDAVISSIKNAFPRITTLSLRIAKPDIFHDCSVSVEKRVSF